MGCRRGRQSCGGMRTENSMFHMGEVAVPSYINRVPDGRTDETGFSELTIWSI